MISPLGSDERNEMSTGVEMRCEICTRPGNAVVLCGGLPTALCEAHRIWWLKESMEFPEYDAVLWAGGVLEISQNALLGGVVSVSYAEGAMRNLLVAEKALRKKGLEWLAARREEFREMENGN